MATFNGTDADETYDGTSGVDDIYGGGGADTLNGKGEKDLIDGGSGADTINAGDGDDVLSSYDHAPHFDEWNFYQTESLDIYAEHDVLTGGSGNDAIAAGAGDDVYGGGADTYDYLYINFLGATEGVHADFLQMVNGQIDLAGGHIEGIEATPFIAGSNYDDYIRPISRGFPFTVVHGNGGNDTIFGDYYNDSVYGDDGDDTIDMSASGYSPEAYGGSGNDHMVGSAGAIAKLYGGDDDDYIENNGFMDGGAGNDEMHWKFSYYDGKAYGGAGDDTISDDVGAGVYEYVVNVFRGGAGSDNLSGGTADDELYSDGDTPDGLDKGLEQDTLNGGDDSDTLSIGYGDNADGGAGKDHLTIACDPAGSGVTLDTADLIGGGPFAFGGGTIQNIETLDALYLTDSADTVHVAPNGGPVDVYGLGGDDVLQSDSFGAHVYGGDGNDQLSASIKSQLTGGDGDDTYFIFVDHVDVAEGGGIAGGTDTVKTTIDYSLGANVENLVLKGFDGLGGTGNGLANRLIGNQGDNALSGLNGMDVLRGGGGGDTLSGGKLADRFVFHRVGDFGGVDELTADRITDFSQADLDRIDLHAIDAADGQRKFHFIGTDAFDGQAGELRYEISGGHTLITGDVNGDSAADFMLVLDGVVTLVQHDFYL